MSANPRTTNAPTIFRLLDDPRIQKGMAAVAGKYLTPEKMLRLCINAVKKTPRLMECDPQTVLGAMMTSAALGLEPNTVQQQAFLIPYKRRAKVDGQWIDVYDCQFQIGARGFVTLAYRVPDIKVLKAEAIHDGDLWEHMEGSESFLRYAKALKDRGPLIGAFNFVRMEGGLELACVLPLEEIHKIRARSETYRALTRNVLLAENDRDRQKAQTALDETPWVMWEDDMAAKSAIKKHAKQLPLTGAAGASEFMAATQIDSAVDAAQVDLRMMADPDVVRATVDDGIEPPRIENDPSPTLEEVTPRASAVRMPRGRAAAAPAEAATAAAPAAVDPASAAAADAAASAAGLATPAEKAYIRRKLAELNITVEEACKEAGIRGDFENLAADGFIKLRDLIRGAGK